MKTSEEADTVLAENRKLVSDAKRYHLDNFSSFKITMNRLDLSCLKYYRIKMKVSNWDYNATNPNIIPWASNSRKRIFSEQGSFDT